MTKTFIAFQHLVPQHALSKAAGRIAASNNPMLKKAAIELFAKAYGITLDEYARKDFGQFASFNDFFTRELATGARPIDPDPLSICCPADGSMSQIGHIEGEQILQAKGIDYSAAKLLGSADSAKQFAGGVFATIYLAPSNYHRVHMPLAATLTQTRYIPGDLFSVNNTTASHVDALFARNERMVCLFEVGYQGQRHSLAVVLVGAMIVAGIETVATGKMQHSKRVITQTHQMPLAKGDELGRFYLGSTAIVLLPKSLAATWGKLNTGDTVKMGQALGKLG